MDAAQAEVLVQVAEDGRARVRRQQPDAATEVEARYPEMMAALDWYVGHDQHDAAFRLASFLVPFWISTKRIDDGDRWFTSVLGDVLGADVIDAVGGGPGWARASYDHGYLVFFAGRYDLATRRFTRARDLAASLDDATLQALALAGLARVALSRDVDEAVHLLREALSVTEGLDDGDEGRSSALHVLGVALQMSGDLEGARDVMQRRLTMGSERGDVFIVWVESANLSMVERQLGNLDRAEQLARQALAIDSGRGDEMAIAWTLNGLAAVAAAKLDLDRAATLNAVAAALLQRAGGEWPPDERVQFDETVAAVTDGLSPAQLDQARARAADMATETAVAYALGGAGT